ncbi:hypothetical protein [Geodermatophilus poikilotrophus]|uniref:Uncharacterized protein n=1 Tax=Geodermatophilus poikilotrophus TaxID=1333667 RepID=A0A1I0DMV6_9ACTN|nr:hypothetical protein [Geodermatophilus poikilotrophus]SET33196.1 hypothetical protein SAMN04488546_2001 [Geodermatophilus poikilotrophus]
MTGRERALGGTYVDLIRDGADVADDYGAEYDRRVWKALNSTAISAMQAGYDFARWTSFLDEAASSLGRQARRAGGRKERSTRAYRQLLGKVWDNAEKFVKAHPLPTDAEVAVRIAGVREFVADADVDIAASQRAVLAAACDLAEQHGTTRPALPLHELVARTGLTQKAVRHALAKSDGEGLLTRERAGDVRRRRAALYRLPSPATLAGARTPPKTGLCAPRAQSYVPLNRRDTSVTASVTDADAADRKRQQDRERQRRHRLHGRGDHSLCTHPANPMLAASGLPVHVPHQRATTSATPTTEENDTVNLTDLARANAEINRLKDEIREDLRAELLAELGLADRHTAPVRHLRPVDDRATSPSMETAR